MSTNDKQKTTSVKSSAVGDLAALAGSLLLVAGAIIVALGLGKANTAGGSALIWIGAPMVVGGLVIILLTVLITRQ